VGFVGCTIGAIRAIENNGGAFFGMGANNIVNEMSVGSCAGWAVGDNSDGLGGPSSGFTLNAAEFDDVQYGVDISRVTSSNFGPLRFVHRYNFGPLNPSGGYWPRVCVQANAAYLTSQITMQIVDRIETGGTKPDLGQFFDMDSAGGNLADIIVRRRISDGAGLGINLSDYYSNFDSNTKIYYTDGSGNIVIDTLGKSAALARAPTSFAIPNGGFATAPNTVAYSSEQFDPSLSYDNTTYTYTCRSYGVYSISARIVLAVPVGTRIRMAVILNGLTSVARFFYATTTNAQCYELNANLVLTAGSTLSINADQNSGAPVNLTTLISADENQFFVTQV
jgi:hypothetical protein